MDYSTNINKSASDMSNFVIAEPKKEWHSIELGTCSVHGECGAIPSTRRATSTMLTKSEKRSFEDGGRERSERTPLTNYKEFVDISKYYGLNASQLSTFELKLEKQKQFLQTTYLKNNKTLTTTPLEDVVISPNHGADRYLAQINNRIDTLEREAKANNLIPVFLTITLPSEFHAKKTIMYGKNKGKLIPNSKYNGTTPNEATKVLTKMFTRLRHDRSMKELSKSQRIYYRVNEPHKDGTPHTHILLFIPQSSIARIEKAFTRLFDIRGNKFEKEIRSATAYVMKYINKVLPNSKGVVSEKDKYLNCWYSTHHIYRFSASRSLAPLYLYKLLYNKYSLFELTQVKKRGLLELLVPIDGTQIAEIWQGDELLYVRDDNFEILNMSNQIKQSSQNFHINYEVGV